MSEPTEREPLTIETVIAECEMRANHRGGESYDHVKASGVLPYLRELESTRTALRAAVERADIAEARWYEAERKWPDRLRVVDLKNALTTAESSLTRYKTALEEIASQRCDGSYDCGWPSCGVTCPGTTAVATAALEESPEPKAEK